MNIYFKATGKLSNQSVAIFDVSFIETNSA